MNEKQHDRRGWYKKYKEAQNLNVQLSGKIGQLERKLENANVIKQNQQCEIKVLCEGIESILAANGKCEDCAVLKGEIDSYQATIDALEEKLKTATKDGISHSKFASMQEDKAGRLLDLCDQKNAVIAELRSIIEGKIGINAVDDF